MAKKKGQVVKIALVCTTCNTQNYITKLNKATTPKLFRKKFCPNCLCTLEHKGKEKLK